MLTRIRTRAVRQTDEKLFRDWYHSADADVYVEHDRETGDLVSFDVDWDGPRGVRLSVTWSREAGLRTGRIDTGDCLGALHHKRSPLLLWDPRRRPERVEEARKIVQDSAIEEGIRESLLKRLQP